MVLNLIDYQSNNIQNYPKNRTTFLTFLILQLVNTENKYGFKLQISKIS